MGLIAPERAARRARRALSATGKKTVYRLGKGGMDPRLPHPGAECDCSGFASWVWDLSRHQGDKGKPWSPHIVWLATETIWADAKGKQRLFVPIASAEPGCAIVYPDRRKSQGHIGIVTRADLTGVDCATDSFRTYGDAIRERSLAWMLGRGAILVAMREDLA